MNWKKLFDIMAIILIILSISFVLQEQYARATFDLLLAYIIYKEN